MTVVNHDNTLKILFTTVVVLALLSLACNQPVTSISTTPAVSASPTVVNSPAATSTATAEPDNSATVVNAVVNVRAAPANTSDVVGYLVAGDRVDVLSCTGSWCEIGSPIEGFVFLGCLSGVDNPDELKCEAK